MKPKTKLSKSQMRQHIEQLARIYSIIVSIVRRPHQSFALREVDGAADEIAISPVRSEITYAIALHEIGHIRGRYQRSRYTRTREEWAWQWARH